MAIEDLAIERLWVVYPGRTEYALADRITVIPLESVAAIAAALRRK